MSGTMQNELDISSRSYGQSKWDGKPAFALIMSQFLSSLSGFGVNHYPGQSLIFLNMYSLQQWEVYIANSFELIGEREKIHNDRTVKLLQTVVDVFIELISN